MPSTSDGNDAANNAHNNNCITATIEAAMRDALVEIDLASMCPWLHSAYGSSGGEACTVELYLTLLFGVDDSFQWSTTSHAGASSLGRSSTNNSTPPPHRAIIFPVRLFPEAIDSTSVIYGLHGQMQERITNAKLDDYIIAHALYESLILLRRSLPALSPSSTIPMIQAACYVRLADPPSPAASRPLPGNDDHDHDITALPPQSSQQTPTVKPKTLMIATDVRADVQRANRRAIRAYSETGLDTALRRYRLRTLSETGHISRRMMPDVLNLVKYADHLPEVARVALLEQWWGSNYIALRASDITLRRSFEDTTTSHSTSSSSPTMQQ
jgi:hypothetical protein